MIVLLWWFLSVLCLSFCLSVDDFFDHCLLTLAPEKAKLQ